MRESGTSTRYVSSLGGLNILRVGVLMMLLVSLIQVARAQQAVTSATPAPAPSLALTAKMDAPSAGATHADSHYRIGPLDVLEIHFFKHPELSSTAMRVDGRGMISMPLLEDEIQAACHTEAELAAEIAKRYLKFYKHPHIEVFIKEYQAEPVAVIGAVNTPSRFQLHRRVRLLELLTFANGPAERAGQTIQVVHAAPSTVCRDSVPSSSEVRAATNIVSYKLSDTLRGEEEANPYVQPGDIISILDAAQVYVVGNVVRPSALPIREPITVSRAIAMAGGTMRDTKSDRIRIVRQVPGSASKTEIYVNLKAIDKHQADDVALQANDIVDVPSSGGKALIHSLVGMIAPTASQLPMRVIP